MSDDPRLLEARAELLKLRACLHDPATGLPTLPAVLEPVRRRLESGETVGLVFFDLRSEERIEEVFGWETYDGLLRQLAATIQRAAPQVLKEHDLTCIAGVRSDEFLIFLGAPVGTGQIKHRLDRARDRLLARLAEDLWVQFDSERPRGLGIHSATVPIRYEPTTRIERAIYKAVDEARAICRRERDQQQTLRLNELRRILAVDGIFVRYQPIVALADGGVHGFEALSASPSGDLFESPEMLFSFAEETDQIVELERLCRTTAIRGAGVLGSERKLFLNTSARGLCDPGLLGPEQRELLASVGLAPENLVVEVTERVAIAGNREVLAAVERLRTDGVQFAVDDVGAGYASLQAVAEVEPQYLKFDLSLVRDIHQSRIKQGLLESLANLATKIDSRIIAEGVERVEEYHTLRELGVPLAQGFLFAAPQPEMLFDLRMPE